MRVSWWRDPWARVADDFIYMKGDAELASIIGMMPAVAVSIGIGVA